jgi:1,4-alpha-glucan branching enzyme
MNAKNKIKQTDACCGSQGVCLEITWPGAEQVSIAGSFNDWHPSVTPMIRLSEGKWAKELSLAPGRYEYRFVVDGQWVDDPAATELVPNVFGSANAVLEVRPASRRADAAPKRTTGNVLPPPRVIARRGVSNNVAAMSR